jgi:hypothetical protein
MSHTISTGVLSKQENTMGLIDFIKDAGELIFGQGKEASSGDAPRVDISSSHSCL